MQKFVLALCAVVLLSGCKPNAGIVCPTIRAYSPAFLKSARAELMQVETTAPHLVMMMNDYGVTRDAIRKCMSLRGSG